MLNEMVCKKYTQLSSKVMSHTDIPLSSDVFS